MYGWRRSRESTSGASYARSDRSHERGSDSKPRLRGTAPPAVENRPLLGECLFAALDAAEQIAGAEDRLVAILDDARRNDDAHVEVFALDALARIAAEAGDIVTAHDLCDVADRRMEAASHFITDLDRVDARWVRHTTREAG